jgi:hypothetical protein
MMNWIKMSEREPPTGEKVLVYGKCGVGIGIVLLYGPNRLFKSDGAGIEYQNITHWAEIVPPERETK